MTFPLRLMLANLWLFKPLLVKKLPEISRQAAELLGTTCSFHDLATETGGKRCTARIVLRCVNEQDLKTDLTQLRTLATKHGVRVTDCGKSYLRQPSDPQSPAYGRIVQCIRAAFPDVPLIPFVLSDVTDARFFADLSPCVIRFAPLRLTAQQLASVHTTNENVDIASVGMAVFFYRSLLETYVSGKEFGYEEPDEQMTALDPLPEDIQMPAYDEMMEPVDCYAEPDSFFAEDPLTAEFAGEIPYDDAGEYYDFSGEELPEADTQDVDFPEYLEEESLDFDLNTLTNWEEIL